MRLSEALAAKMMDVRLRDKLVSEGKITKAQVQEFMKSLEDDTDNAEYADNTKKSKPLVSDKAYATEVI